MPRVSIIIPTYNRAGLLPRSIKSALAAGDDLEVIVVDDGSTDETPQVCAGTEGIRYIRLEQNLGPARARNAGLLESRAKLVSALGDDDLRLPGSLNAQVRLLEASPQAVFCYGRVLLAEGPRQSLTGEVVPARCPAGDIFWELLEQNFVPDLSVVARKEKLLERGLFNPDLSGAEDWDMWLRLTEKWPVVALEEPVAIYRRARAGSGQMCSNTVETFRRMMQVQEQILGLPRARIAPYAKRYRVRRRLVDLAYQAMVYEAELALTEDNRELARHQLREAFRLRPFRAATGPRIWKLLAG